MTGAVDTAAVVDNVLSQTGSLESVTNKVAGQDIAAGQLKCDNRRPVALVIAVVPKTSQDPDKVLVVLLLAQNTDQDVKVVNVDLGWVDFQLAEESPWRHHAVSSEQLRRAVE